MNFETGVITLAIPKDYKKAIALSLTLKEKSPNLPISVVCPSLLKEKLAPFFDKVIIERDDLKGFEHKLFLDLYSPYKNTFFFDADILIIKDITPIISKWKGSAYAVRGYQTKNGTSSFGLNREYVLKKINKQLFSVIDGAGHAYFEKPACNEVFDKARSILNDYSSYRAPRFADEDGMGIAMTILDIEPKQNEDFLGSPWCAKPKTFTIDTNKSHCYYEDKLFGPVSPYVVHFPKFVFPFTYAREIKKTYKRHGLSVSGIWTQAINELIKINILWPISGIKKKIIKTKTS